MLTPFSSSAPVISSLSWFFDTVTFFRFLTFSKGSKFVIDVPSRLISSSLSRSSINSKLSSFSHPLKEMISNPVQVDNAEQSLSSVETILRPFIFSNPVSELISSKVFEYIQSISIVFL